MRASRWPPASWRDVRRVPARVAFAHPHRCAACIAWPPESRLPTRIVARHGARAAGGLTGLRPRKARRGTGDCERCIVGRIGPAGGRARGGGWRAATDPLPPPPFESPNPSKSNDRLDGPCIAADAGMVHSKIELFVHLVWTTKYREPWLSGNAQRFVFRFIHAEVTRLGGRVIALGGMPDHVHLLAAIPSTLSVADLMNQVKGASQRRVTQMEAAVAAAGSPRSQRRCQWQTGYAAYSVSNHQVPVVRRYVECQREHHAAPAP